jgi:hypothetical protein
MIKHGKDIKLTDEFPNLGFASGLGVLLEESGLDLVEDAW